MSFLDADLDPASARRALIEAAQAGNPIAQLKMGYYCRVGDEFTDQDYVAAVRWYQAAAKQGEPQAQNDLGSMFLHGMGVAKDAAKAAHWYRKAALQGEPIGQLNLGFRHLHGDGIEQDDGQAAHWFMQAAVQGNAEAAGELGTLFRFGRGVRRDVVTAAELHLLAAGAGDVVSVGNLTSYLMDIEREALDGSVRACLVLARMFVDAIGVDADKTRAYAWLITGQSLETRDGEEAAREELHDRGGALEAELTDQEMRRACALSHAWYRRRFGAST